MMDQRDIDQIAYLIVGDKMRQVAKKAAEDAIKEIQVGAVIQEAFGVGVDDELYSALVASADLIKNGGTTYIGIKDAQEIRWEQQETDSADGFSMKFTDLTPVAPPF